MPHCLPTDPLAPPSNGGRRRPLAALAAAGLVVVACGGDDDGIGTGDVDPGLTSPTVVIDDPDDLADGDADPEPMPGLEDVEVELRPLDTTIYLPGFEIEFVQATINRDDVFTPLDAASIEVDAVVTNLVDDRVRPPGFAHVEVNGETVRNERSFELIDPFESDAVTYRFVLEPEVDPDDAVLWFAEDNRNPAAVPLGASGPTYTLEPIAIDVDTPDPFGSLTFDARGAVAHLHDPDAPSGLAGYAYLVLDLAVTNTGSEEEGFFRIEIEVDGETLAPGGEVMSGGNLRVEPGETLDPALRRVQFPIYGDRVVVRGLPDPNSPPVLLFDLEFPGLSDAVPDDVRPVPYS